MNSTDLRLEYALRSSAYELPDHVELALENDYVENSFIYTDETFKQIRVFFLIFPETSASQILESVRSW